MGHWYKECGEACHEIEDKNGKLRGTTLRDARKLNLMPSVTTILQLIANEGIVRWKIQLAVETSRGIPEHISNVEALQSANKAIDDYANAKADVGVELHESLEEFAIAMKNNNLELIQERLSPADYIAFAKLLSEAKVEHVLHAEINLAHKDCGYAGQIDLVGVGPDNELVFFDLKTKDTKGKGVKGFYPDDKHGFQLGAYANLYQKKFNTGKRQIRGAIGFISRDELNPEDKSRVCKVQHYDGTRMIECMNGFSNLANVWFSMKKYDPRMEF